MTAIYEQGGERHIGMLTRRIALEGMSVPFLTIDMD